MGIFGGGMMKTMVSQMLNMLPENLKFVGNLITGTIEEKRETVAILSKAFIVKAKTFIAGKIGHEDFHLLITAHNNTQFINAVKCEGMQMTIIESWTIEQLCAELDEKTFSMEQNG